MDSLFPNSPESNPEKYCSVCKQKKPATAEFFSRDRERKDGLSSRCKECESVRSKARWAAAHPDRQASKASVPEGMKRCPKCELLFLATPEFFQRDTHRKDGLYSYCKECSARLRNTPEARAEKLVYNHAYYSSEENHERILAQRKDNYHTDPKVRQDALDWNKRPEVREYNKAYLKDYNKTPKGRAKNRANKHKYRAREKTVGGLHTAEQIQDLLKRQKYRCYYCKDKFEKKNGTYVYQVEHTFPISRVAGSDIPANDISYLVLSCWTCNRDKGNKFPWEWPKGGRLL